MSITKKRWKRQIQLTLILLMICLLGTSCTIAKAKDINRGFCKNTDEVIKMIEDNKSEINPYDYIDIIMKDSELLFNKTTEKQVVDKELCNLMYDVSFKNKTKDIITFNFVMYIPKEMYNIILTIEPSVSKSEDLVLEPGKGTGIGSGRLMTHYDKLDKEKREIFEKYKNTVYFEFHINGKKAYVKYKKE